MPKNKDNDNEEYLKRAARAFQDQPVRKIFERIKAIVGPSNMPPTQQGKLAEQALKADAKRRETLAQATRRTRTDDPPDAACATIAKGCA